MPNKAERKRSNLERKMRNRQNPIDRLRNHRYTKYLEVEGQLYELNAVDSESGKSVMSVMQDYLDNGTTYINHKIGYGLHMGYHRYFLINLHNNPTKMDVVVLKSEANNT